MPRLTAAKKKAATELAKELFEIDVIAEKHMAILRYVDQAKVAEAHAAIAKDKAPVGCLPPQNRMQECIDYAQQELELRTCKSSRTQLSPTYASSWLAGENDHIFTKEVIKHRVAMHTQYQIKYGFYGDANGRPSTLSLSLLLQTLALVSIHHPIELAACDLSSDELQDTPQLKLGATEVERFRQDPDSLLDLFFVSSSSGEEKFYQVASIMAKKTGKSFYLTFADEGPDAVCYPSDFFTLLTSSHQVMA
ncbi:hypothetical protein R3P38DRAFT_3203503 [Favolaschia claudopus]|uniref:Uncharacterized protein n=1 Tax=Favolaschia claudopus TaxID=2862362 RepID=A0AAW0AUN7_9AGAR